MLISMYVCTYCSYVPVFNAVDRRNGGVTQRPHECAFSPRCPELQRGDTSFFLHLAFLFSSLARFVLLTSSGLSVQHGDLGDSGGGGVTRRAMATTRRFQPNDLLRFNAVNVDKLTETVRPASAPCCPHGRARRPLREGGGGGGREEEV